MRQQILSCPGPKHFIRKVVSSAARWFMVILATSPVVPAQQELKNLAPRLAETITRTGKKTVAVVDFTDLQGNVTELGRYLAEEFSAALVEESRSFDVIDRIHLKVILQEHKLSATGLIDPQTARKLGQIAGVDALVSGSITPFGDTVKLSVRVIDASTAKVIGAASTDIPKTKTIEELLAKGIAGSSSGAPTGTQSGSSPSGVSIQEDEFLFVLKSCSQSIGRLSCSGTITNKAQTRRRLALDLGTTLIDDQGNQYKLRYINLGSISGFSPGQDLEPELPISFSCEAENVQTRVSRVSVLLQYAGTGRGFRSLALRDMPVQQK